MSDDKATHRVYRCFDENGVLLYIGCTVNVEERFKAHARTGAPWWPFLKHSAIEGPFPRVEAYEVEAAAIATEMPCFNALHDHSALKRANLTAAGQMLNSLDIRPGERDEDWYAARKAISKLIRHRYPVVDDEARLTAYRAAVEIARQESAA